MTLSAQLTVWLDNDDDQGRAFRVAREDNSVMFESDPDSRGDVVRIYVAPALFGLVRATMDAIEGRS